MTRLLSVVLPDEDQWTDADWSLLKELQPGDGMQFLRFHSDKGSVEKVSQLVRDFGHSQLLVRMMGWGIPGENPVEWADTCFQRLADVEYQFSRWGYPIALHLIPANEMNLVDEEGGHKGWKKHARWLERFAARWGEIVAGQNFDALLHLPAPSRQGEDVSHYWQACKERGLDQYYAYIDVHGYGEDVAVSLQEAKDVWGDGALYWLTECNNCDMAKVNDIIAANVVMGANWFTTSWRVYDESGGVVDEPHPGDTGFTLDRNPDRKAEFCAVGVEEPEVETPDGDPPPLPPPSYTRDQMIQRMRGAADSVGIPQSLVLACAIAESNIDQYARRPTSAELDESYWPDVSFGAFQQTVRWAPGYPYGDAWPGSHVVAEFEPLYYDFDYALEVALPQLAAYWRQDGDVVNALCHYNWPARNPATNPNRPNYVQGYTRAVKILEELSVDTGGGVLPLADNYDSNTPLILQPNDWACSACTLAMALSSVGQPTTWWDAVEMLGMNIRISMEQGLLDGSGAGLLDVIHEQGYVGNYRPRSAGFSWEDLISLAGSRPVMIGGTAWNHWVFVRRYDPVREVFDLGNPSPNWKNAQQELDWSEFINLGAFSCVWIDTRDTIPQPPPEDSMHGFVTALAYVCDDLGDGLEANSGDPEQIMNVVREMRRVREDTLGPRP